MATGADLIDDVDQLVGLASALVWLAAQMTGEQLSRLRGPGCRSMSERRRVRCLADGPHSVFGLRSTDELAACEGLGEPRRSNDPLSSPAKASCASRLRDFGARFAFSGEPLGLLATGPDRRDH